MLSFKEREKIRQMLEEDIGLGDITSKAVISSETQAKAEVIAGGSGVLAGAREASTAFKEMEVEVKIIKGNGNSINSRDIVARLKGPARGILAAERVALNLLSRMSGIATATREMLEKARERNPEVKIAATRKTAPLLTSFDKRAVQIAGGEPHRYGLDDFILIKDNHIKLSGAITKAVEKARKSNPSKKIEVEVNSLGEALETVKAGAEMIMLDNISPSGLKEVIEELEEAGVRDKVIIEVSGGINPSNVGEYAQAGVDIISSSYMTMQAPALDVSLEIE